MIEVWRPIEGFEGLYEVSNTGKVRSLDRVVTSKAGWETFKKGVELKPLDNGNGYKTVALWKNGKMTQRYIHRLVVQEFIGPPPSESHQVAHWDGSRDNNKVGSLRWSTSVENAQDKWRHGTSGIGVYKEKCKRGHEMANENLVQYGKIGQGACRACILMHSYLSRRAETVESERQSISDDYYRQILSGGKVFYQPTCHRGHALSGENAGVYKKYNKKYCKSCERARKMPPARRGERTIEEVANELYATRYGGG